MKTAQELIEERINEGSVLGGPPGKPADEKKSAALWSEFTNGLEKMDLAFDKLIKMADSKEMKELKPLGKLIASITDFVEEWS